MSICSISKNPTQSGPYAPVSSAHFLQIADYIRSFIGPVFKNKVESPMVLCINVRTNTRKLFIPQNIPPNSLHVVRNKQFSASDKLSAINGPIDYFKNISVTHRYSHLGSDEYNAIGRKKHESGYIPDRFHQQIWHIVQAVLHARLTLSCSQCKARISERHLQQEGWYCAIREKHADPYSP